MHPKWPFQANEACLSWNLWSCLTFVPKKVLCFGVSHLWWMLFEGDCLFDPYHHGGQMGWAGMQAQPWSPVWQCLCWGLDFEPAVESQCPSLVDNSCPSSSPLCFFTPIQLLTCKWHGLLALFLNFSVSLKQFAHYSRWDDLIGNYFVIT